MDTGKNNSTAANKKIDKGKIERAAVRAVEEFIDNFAKMEPNIFAGDKERIWDGEINVFENEEIKNENFFAKIPIQVKGTTNTTDKSYRIGREHLIGYKKERGTLFFLVQEDEKLKPIKILYNLLSLDALDTLLEQKTQTIKIDLKRMPDNPDDFEKEIFEFARKRNGEDLDNPGTKEVESLISEFEKIEEDVDKIKKNIRKRNELKFLLQEIKELKKGKTVGWRDKFVYYSQNALDIAIENIEDSDFTNLQFALGLYLYNQKQYHLVEDYYVKALEAYRERAKNFPFSFNIGNVATTLNNLGNLHDDLNRPKEAEEEYKEALKIYRELAKDNPEAYIDYVATTLNNYALLYAKQKNFHKAIDTIDEAIACMPEKAEYYDSKGEILLMKGDEQGALAMWRKVMELEPDLLSKYNGETELHRQLKERGLID